MVWPYFTNAVDRLVALFTGLNTLEIVPRHTTFPQCLSPSWVTSLLLIRDLLLYLPALLGVFILFFKKTHNNNAKFFLVYSVFSFGLLLVLDNLVFRLGTTRILSLGLPFFVFLSAFFYCSFFRNSRILKRTIKLFIVVSLFGLLISSAFIGLWGHSFAPMHLFNPTIDSDEVGERNKDFDRIVDFNEKVPISDFEIVWADDRSPMLFLLEPEDFGKIQWISVNRTDKLGSFGNEVVYILKEMNMYFYHAGVFSPVEDSLQTDFVKEQISHQLEQSFNQVYDDGENGLWISIKTS
jgi:hypothetical protein